MVKGKPVKLKVYENVGSNPTVLNIHIKMIMIKTLKLEILKIIVLLLIVVAYFAKLKRKIVSAIQRLISINVVGYICLLESLACGSNIFNSLSEIFKFETSLLSVAVFTTNCYVT